MEFNGVIGVPLAGGRYTKVDYELTQLEEHSELCINDGRIVELTLMVEGEVTAYYDGEWFIKPKSDLPTQIAYCILLNKFNV